MIIFNKFKLPFIISFALLYFEGAHSSHHHNRGILIFLDDSEGIRYEHNRVSLSSPLGAISYDLSLALFQNTSPIIASKSLLANLFSGRDINDFSPSEWCVKEINPSLVLLLRFDYLESMNIFQRNVINNPLNKHQVYSEIEKKIGLKVNHLIETSFQEIKNTSYAIRRQATKNNFADYFSQSLSDVFVPKSIYSNNDDTISWSIYMSGHGEAGTRLTGLSIDGFIQALDFFENEISTNFLAYMSCFSGGLTQQKVYGQRKLSFPVIAQVISDVVGHLPYSATYGATDISKSSKRFDNFIISVANNMAFTESCEQIIPRTPEDPKPFVKSLNFAQLSRWSDIPSLRQAQTDYFEVMVGEDRLMSIGSTGTFFDEQSFAAKKPKGLLFYTNEIPFELKLDDPDFAVIISMVPGQAIHSIKKISSLTKTLPEILQTFMRIDPTDVSHYRVEKRYFIEEISDKDDNTFYDLTIEILNNNWHAHFIKDGNFYRLTPDNLLNPLEPIDRQPFFFGRSNLNLKDLVKQQSLSSKWSRASLEVVRNNLNLYNSGDLLEELAESLKSTLAFHSRKQQRTKELVNLVDPNVKIDGLSLVNWLIKRDKKEVNFNDHQTFRLELLNILLERGVEIKDSGELAKQAVLDLVDAKIIYKLLEHGVSLNVHEKIADVKWRWGNHHDLLYWVVDKVLYPEGRYQSEGFKERQIRAMPIIKLLVEKGANIDDSDNDIIRHAINGRLESDIILYFLEHSNKIDNIYAFGPLWYAIDRGYPLEVIKKLVEKGATIPRDVCLYKGNNRQESNKIAEFLLSKNNNIRIIYY